MLAALLLRISLCSDLIKKVCFYVVNGSFTLITRHVRLSNVYYVPVASQDVLS
jgi:hypothetical protein